MPKIILLITIASFLPSLWAVEPTPPSRDCDAQLRAATGLESTLEKYRALLLRAQQTHVNSGAHIAQRLILKSLESQLRDYGWTDEQIVAIEPQSLEDLPPPLEPAKTSKQSTDKYRMIFIKDRLHEIRFADGSEMETAQFVRAYLAHAPFQTSVTFPSGSRVSIERMSEEDPILLLYVNGSTLEIDTQTAMFAEFMDGLAEGYKFFPREDVYVYWGPYTVLFARIGRQPNAETLFMEGGSMVLGVCLDPVGYKISADQKTMYLRHGMNHISVITLDYLQNLGRKGVFVPEPL